MTIDEAIASLSKFLLQFYKPGSISIGKGNDCIYLYGHYKNIAKDMAFDKYKGYKVIYRYVGKITPL